MTGRRRTGRDHERRRAAAGAGAGGLVLSTNGGGPTPEVLDPMLTGTLQYEAAQTQQQSTLFTGGQRR